MISIVQLKELDKAYSILNPKERRDWAEAKMEAVKDRNDVGSDIPDDNIASQLIRLT
jgi:hypothetical protein